MGLPSKRRTKQSQRDRRSHHALKKISVRQDEQGNAYLPHQVNPTTGAYRGKQIVNTTKRATRLARKKAKVQA